MKIYCDLDGVLCNFNDRFEEFSGISPEKYRNKYGIRAFWKEIEKHGVKWWSDMEWLEDGKILWKFLIRNFNDIEILTGSPWGKVGEYAHKGKEIWAVRELGSYKVNHKSGSRKWEICQNSTDILIDDTSEVIEKWINKGNGIGIIHSDVRETIKDLSFWKKIKF